MSINKNIKVIPFPDIENAYIVISGVFNECTGNGCEKRMSFFYGDENGGCELEPEHGPITRITPCGQSHPEAKPHWFYAYFTGHGNWSQLAVCESGIIEAYLRGDYKMVFGILKDWSL